MDRCEMAKLAGERFIDNICAAAYFDGIELDFNTAYRLVRESDGMSYNLEVLLSNAMLAWNCITNTLDAEISTSYIYKLHDIISEGLSDKKSNRDRYLTNEGELEKIINSLSDVKCPIRRACGVFLNYIEFKPFDNFNFLLLCCL